MNKVHDAAARLERRVKEVRQRLAEPGEGFARRPAPGKWSPKEELGHLIDSANNNHQRFVRGQFEDRPQIGYRQDDWVRSNKYQEMDPRLVIDMWVTYNTFLVSLMRMMDAAQYQRECISGSEPHTIGWLIVDYVDHVEHHVDRVLGILPVAEYPKNH